MKLHEAHLQYMISLGIFGDSPFAEVCEGDEGAVDRAAAFVEEAGDLFFEAGDLFFKAEDQALLAELLEVAE